MFPTFIVLKFLCKLPYCAQAGELGTRLYDSAVTQQILGILHLFIFPDSRATIVWSLPWHVFPQL